MISPADTTLREQPGRPQRAIRRLIAVCVASTPLGVPRALEVGAGAIEIGRAVGPEALGLEADPRLSRRHAVLEIDRAGVATIESAGPPIEINGRPVVGRAPLRDGDVILMGESALVYRERGGAADVPSIDGMVGESPTIRAVRRAIARVAPTPVTVLVLGESGTGKEVSARALHALSGREGPFVAVNCAAIPAALAESELFGHVAGAFTGAQKASPGVFRAAHGGTLFLDELADLPLELQPKLLRALEERTVVSVGSTTTTPVDVRVVTATNRDLIAEAKAGRFRGDLYARLAEFTLHLPPLRERREDVLAILGCQYRDALPPLRFELVRALLVHPWPFNVRELRTIAVQLRLLADEVEGEPLGVESIAERLASTARLCDGEVEGPGPAAPRDAAQGTSSSVPPRTGSSPPARSGAAPPGREDLEALLRAHRGNVTDVARATGRSRKQVYRWLEAHAIDPTRYRDGSTPPER